MEPEGRTIRGHIGSVLAEELDNHLIRNKEHRHGASRRRSSARRRSGKRWPGLQEGWRKEQAKKTKLVNKKLRDCRVHLNTKHRLPRGDACSS